MIDSARLGRRGHAAFPIFHGEVDIEHVYLLRLLTNANEEIRWLDIGMKEILCMFNCMCTFSQTHLKLELCPEHANNLSMV